MRAPIQYLTVAPGACIALAGCGAESTQNAGIELSPEVRRLILQTGVNEVGLTEVGEDAWIQLAVDGCEQGAWEKATAERLASELLSVHDPSSQVRPDD